MHTICPACSGLIRKGPRCTCGEEMIDSGPVTDYLGPYSPYDNCCFESPGCTHLFTCPACGNDLRLAVRQEQI